MARIEGLQKVVKALQDQAAKVRRDTQASVLVGYSAAYALYVHEDVEMKWRGVQRDPRKRSIGGLGGPKVYHQDNPRPRKAEPKGRFWDPQGRGQAKFLEQPARDYADELGRIVSQAVDQGRTVSQGLLLAGYRLQRESMQLAPVDSAGLKQSSFVRLDTGG